MKSFVVPAVAFGAGLLLCSSLASAMVPPAAPASHPAVSPIVNVAHAGAPYKNVDKRNDAGNDTGDAQVDKLNDESLARAKGQK